MDVLQWWRNNFHKDQQNLGTYLSQLFLCKVIIESIWNYAWISSATISSIKFFLLMTAKQRKNWAWNATTLLRVLRLIWTIKRYWLNDKKISNGHTTLDNCFHVMFRVVQSWVIDCTTVLDWATHLSRQRSRLCTAWIGEWPNLITVVQSWPTTVVY